MPNKCCVPGCRGNAKNGPKVHVFSFPKDANLCKEWIGVIPRQDFIPTRYSKVCELHFVKDNIIWSVTAQDSRSGETVTVGLKVPKLKPDAVPTKWLTLIKPCMVLFCQNKGYRPGITYFKLTAGRYRTWMIALGRDPNTEQMSSDNVVCSEHFVERDKFYVKDKLKLKYGAIPKLNLGIRKLGTEENNFEKSQFETWTTEHTECIESETETFETKTETVHLNCEPETNFLPESGDTNFFPESSEPAGFLPKMYESAGRSRESVKTKQSDKLFCRICLKQTEKNSFIPLSLVDINYPDQNEQFKMKSEQIKQSQDMQEILRLVVPDFDYSVTFYPIICMVCQTRLMDAYEFIKECRTNENLIKYYKEKYAPSKNFVAIDEVVHSKSQLVKEFSEEIEKKNSRKRKRQRSCEDSAEQQQFLDDEFFNIIKTEPKYTEFDQPEVVKIVKEFEQQVTNSENNSTLIQTLDCELSENAIEIKTECDMFETKNEEHSTCRDGSSSFTTKALAETTDVMDSFLTNTRSFHSPSRKRKTVDNIS